MPEELKALTERLGQEVHGLREELKRDREDRQADRRRDAVRLAVIVAALVLVGALALGGAYYLIQQDNDRQAATAERQTRALCQSWRQTATSDLIPTSTEVARSLVRTSVDAYRLVGCDQVIGPIGQVDPEAYRPAPRSTGR